MAYSVTLIPGDGIGPEITEATCRVLEAAGVQFNWETEAAGTPLPASVPTSVLKNKLALKGPTTPLGAGSREFDAAWRCELDLFASVWHCKHYANVRGGHPAVDLIVMCENGTQRCEGAESVSKSGGPRIVRLAFGYARAHKRRKVTAVTGADGRPCGDGRFVQAARDSAGDCSDIDYDEVQADDLWSALAQNPELFDVLVVPNQCGDAVLDRCAGFAGGPGMVAGTNIGEDVSLFEPAHGSAPAHAGMNKANPIAMMLCGVLLLRHLKEQDAANRLEQAIAGVIFEGRTVTCDLKHDRNDPSAVGTIQVADAIVARLKAR